LRNAAERQISEGGALDASAKVDKYLEQIGDQVTPLIVSAP